jgi:hypothetical protein
VTTVINNRDGGHSERVISFLTYCSNPGIMKISFLIMFSLLSCSLLYAQEENIQDRIISERDTNIHHSTLRLGVETSTTAYINKNTLDSNGTSRYVSFYANYHHKNNLGISAETYILPEGSNSGFYLTTLTAYYANFQGKLMPIISYSHHILPDNPSFPNTPIQNEVGAQIRLKSNILEPVAGLNWGFGKNKKTDYEKVWDINAFAGVSHLFIWPRKSQQTSLLSFVPTLLAFVPTVQLNAGTDRYFKFSQYTKYISRNRSIYNLLHGNNAPQTNTPGNNNATERSILGASNTFSLTNLESNLHIAFFIGNFSIEPSGSLYFPFRGDDKTPYGYWQVNLNYSLK